MLPQPPSGDGVLEAGAVLRRRSALSKKRSVDLLYMDAAALNGLDRIGDLKNTARGFARLRIRALFNEFHRLLRRSLRVEHFDARCAIWIVLSRSLSQDTNPPIKNARTRKQRNFSNPSKRRGPQFGTRCAKPNYQIV